MITDFLTYNDIPDSLDPAARQRHDLAIHTAGVNWLRQRVEDLECCLQCLLEAIEEQHTEAIRLMVERAKELLRATE